MAPEAPLDCPFDATFGLLTAGPAARPVGTSSQGWLVLLSYTFLNGLLAPILPYASISAQETNSPLGRRRVGQPREHRPVKLIVGMFTGREGLLGAARDELSQAYGPVDRVSPVWPFAFTRYYADEFGEHLLRQFFTFSELMDPARLPEIKLLTNALELESASGDQRQVNVDPGYIDLSKLVLATTKNNQHRIYLGQGIYAEVTLRFTRGSFRPWEWTYPDYRTEHYIGFFNEVRQTYLEQLRDLEVSV